MSLKLCFDWRLESQQLWWYSSFLWFVVMPPSCHSLVFLIFAPICLHQADGLNFSSLYQHLMNASDAQVRPRNSSGIKSPTLVDVSHFLSNVQEVDSVRGYATLTVKEELSWIDFRLAWDPASYSNISSIYLPLGTIWYPDATFISKSSQSVQEGNCIAPCQCSEWGTGHGLSLLECTPLHPYHSRGFPLWWTGKVIRILGVLS